MKRIIRLSLLVAGSLLLNACSSVRWVAITDVRVDDSNSSLLYIMIDACVDVPPPLVVETDTEVRLLVELRHDYSGDQNGCIGGAEVQLSAPIGNRNVVDGRRNREIPVTWSAP